MLVLSRKVGERILIGDDIVLIVTQIQPSSVRIGIEAPRNVNIIREEVPREENIPNLRPYTPNSGK